jgi:hypothetical protein
MPMSIEKAVAYLEQLEADRRAAIAISEQKAEEAKLIRARQEGFQAAMEIFAGAITTTSKAEQQKVESEQRRRRRDIPQLILRELSFSGQAMTTTQIAKAIDYIPERTQIALRRMEISGKLSRDGDGRWIAVFTPATAPSGHGGKAVNGEFPAVAGTLDAGAI